MKHFFKFLLMSVIVLFCLGRTALAEVPFDAGRFMINLPDGYALVPQQADIVYKFSGGGPMMVVIFYQKKEDLPSVFKEFAKSCESSMPGRTLVGSLQQMKINGNQAIFGTYEGKVKGFHLYQAVGSLVFKDSGTLAFFSTYPEKQKAEWEGPVRDTFFSIRAIGAELSGVTDQKTYNP